MGGSKKRKIPTMAVKDRPHLPVEPSGNRVASQPSSEGMTLIADAYAPITLNKVEGHCPDTRTRQGKIRMNNYRDLIRPHPTSAQAFSGENLDRGCILSLSCVQAACPQPAM
jgi:hypothetical protein